MGFSSIPKDIVLLTGITGYTGSHVGYTLLKYFKDKNFHLRASVRSLKALNKLEPLRLAYGDEFFNQIEFVEADLANDESMKAAIKAFRYIIHIASPVPSAAH